MRRATRPSGPPRDTVRGDRPGGDRLRRGAGGVLAPDTTRRVRATVGRLATRARQAATRVGAHRPYQQMAALLLRRTSSRTAVAAVLAAAAAGLTLVVSAAIASPAPVSRPHWIGTVSSPTPPPQPEAPVQQAMQQVAVAPEASPTRPPPPPFTSWAIMDLDTGEIVGSANLAETSTTASMIKAWLVADYLRRTEDPPEDRLEEFRLIIRDSNNAYAQKLFVELGEEASIYRLIDICGLTDSHAVPGYWSNTALSPRDTARMGACLADGRAAGPEWTSWVLAEMRQVRGLGDFGIRHAFPAGQRSTIAIKNGWVIRDGSGEYHVNCLAVGDGWSMGVMTRYPARLGYQHGAEICRSLAAEHLLPRVQ